MLHFGVFYNIGDFPACQLEIQRDNHGAEADKRQIAVNVFGRVAGKQSDIMTGADSLLIKIIAIAFVFGLQLTVGNLLRKTKRHIRSISLINKLVDQH